MICAEIFLDNIHKKGYDAFISNNDVVIVKDGFITQTPVENIISLMTPKEIEFEGRKIQLPKISTEDVVDIMIESHKTKKEIKSGVYDNIQPITKEESLKKLIKLLNK